jgi:hypothetical protein
LGGRSADGVVALVDTVTANVTVDDADVRGYYDRNADLYARPEVRVVRHALASDRAAVDTGEELEVRRGELAGPLEDALFAAAIGDIVGPIETEHGCHVARLEAIRPPSVIPYDDVRDGIAAELLADARARAFGEWLDTRRNALAAVEPAYAHPGDPVNGLPSHRH